MKTPIVGIMAMLLVAACDAPRSSVGSQGGQGVDGASGGASGGHAPDPSDSSSDSSADAADAGIAIGPVACVEQPASKPGANSRLTVNVGLTYAGKTVAFGEPFPLETGTLTLTNFRFYISDAALLRRSGEALPVDLVGDDGSVAAYNIHLVNPEDPSGMTFQIAAPSGDYDGLSFLVGIPDVCNGSDLGRNPPLTATSQMTWPPPFGYLFLRYAGRVDGTSPTDAIPAIIDMGGFPGHIFAPRVAVPGSVIVGAPRTIRLTVALDELFRAVGLPVHLDDYGMAVTGGPLLLGAAQLAGQHVLQNLDAVSVFKLTDQL